ncbi:MarR family winged helix-turn-helix transcriptional regulator [Sneathiella sp.]|uniref:MarR family winged helix-turn-helix transcriptional regulator n=1 Tax=Sneathiella sp. TaxID=1964365 RepID=UPI002FE0A469
MNLILEQFLPYRLIRLTEALSERATQTYKAEYDLSRAEWRAFVLLGQGQEMTATDISYYSTMHKTKVSRAIQMLEKRRWVKREVDERDRRVERISLLPQGRKVYEKLVPMMQAEEAKLMARLGPEKSAALQEGLAALEEIYLEPKVPMETAS